MGAIKQAATADMETIVKSLHHYGARDAAFSDDGYVIFFPDLGKHFFKLAAKYLRLFPKGMPIGVGLTLGGMKVAGWSFAPGRELVAMRWYDGPSSNDVLEEFGSNLDVSPWKYLGVLWLTPLTV